MRGGMQRDPEEPSHSDTHLVGESGYGRQRPRHHARRGGIPSGLRSSIGECFQHAVPLLQALGARGWLGFAVDRASARGNQPPRLLDRPRRTRDRHRGHMRGRWPGSAPEIRRDNPITPLEGTSLKSLFRSQPAKGHPEGLFWEHEGSCAVRRGWWMLLSKCSKPEAGK